MNPRETIYRAEGHVSRAATAALAMATVFALAAIMIQSAQAQAYSVIHNFTGGQDGSHPYAGLTIDRAGHLYGTAANGGAGYGTVFKLSHQASGWVFNPLYSFKGGNDAAFPGARVIIGPDGSLYGTAEGGGSGCGGNGCGTVFNVKPGASACKTALCSWTETVLYSFTGNDGYGIAIGDLAFDQAGNIYGTTEFGGEGPYPSGNGTVWELMPSKGGWTHSVLYRFGGGEDGYVIYSGVIFDEVGNLYGTARQGGGFGCSGAGCGTVYQLTPSGSGWTENILYRFQGGNDGLFPIAGLLLDRMGNLYGGTSGGGSGNGGTVFDLTPANGGWTFHTLYGLAGNGGMSAAPTMDAAGNLYGVTLGDGAYSQGNVFKLTPSGGGWTYTDLYDFTGGSDGGFPISNVVMDASGNLYGTTYEGGSNGLGVAWEITP
jgi:uncharacterized repeat protein (TIGR03803 family)